MPRIDSSINERHLACWRSGGKKFPQPPTTKTGWRPVQVIDLRLTGSGTETCERCGRRDLRFVHTVEHPAEGQLHVGSECARHLCYGYAPEREEQRLRNQWERRSRWLTRKWATSWKGNETITFKHQDKKVRVTVFADHFGGFGYCIATTGDAACFSPRGLPTADIVDPENWTAD